MKTLKPISWRCTAVAVAVLVAIRLLDSDGCLLRVAPNGVQLGAFFSVIVSAIGWIGGWLGSAAAATASYLAAALQWVAGRLSTFIKATGAVFAKSWDALKIVYGDVLKPAVQWIDAHVKRLYDWLTNTFKPVFDVLKRIRQELLDAYARYVRPFLDVIDAIRGGLRVLGDLGVGWAKELDKRLGVFESLITQNFSKLLGELNKVIDVLASVFTVDRLIQRFTFIRTLQRDTRFVWRAMVNPGSRALTEDEQLKLHRSTVTQAAPDLTASLAGYLAGESNDVGDAVDAAVSSTVSYWSTLA